MNWAAEETAGGGLCDRRLPRRLVQLRERLSAPSTACIPAACNGWAESQAAYRLLSNARVAAVDIRLDPWEVRRQCRRRRGPLCPGGGLSDRWADYRPTHPLHVPLLVSASQPLWLFRRPEVCRGAPWYPERLASRPRAGCSSQRLVLFGVRPTPPLPETPDADEERWTGSPRSL